MTSSPTERLEYLRGELRAGSMSYGELAELQGLAGYIDPGDVELLEAAGVPEFPVTIRITGHSVANGNDIYAVEVDGEDYQYEVLVTEKFSGSEWYDESGTTPTDNPIPDNQEEQFSQLIDTYNQLFYPLWQETVEPAITAAVTEVVARLNTASICRHCKAPVWKDDKGSWVDASDGDGCDTDVHTA